MIVAVDDKNFRRLSGTIPPPLRGGHVTSAWDINGDLATTGSISLYYSSDAKVGGTWRRPTRGRPRALRVVVLRP
jgi:hypothetical protein